MAKGEECALAMTPAYNIDDERLEMRHVEEGHSILCTPDEYEKYVLMANRG